MATLPPFGVKVSIVVPVFCSEHILPHLVARILSAMPDVDFELLLIDDASTDNSWGVIETIAGVHPFVRGVRLARNVGQHNAIMAGLARSRGETVVIMDDDLQHPPEFLSLLIAAVKSDSDVCYTRYADRQHALWKRIGSRVNDLVANFLLRKPAELYLSSFKAMRRRIVNEIIKYDGPFSYVDGLILEATSNITTITIQHQRRFEGGGNYNVRKSVSLWLKMATSFSILPLRLATILGVVIAVASVLIIIAIAVQKFLHPETAAGWSSLASLILFMGGVQLLSIGVIGEYVGRTYLRLSRKPQYVVRESVGDNNNEG